MFERFRRQLPKNPLARESVEKLRSGEATAADEAKHKNIARRGGLVAAENNRLRKEGAGRGLDATDMRFVKNLEHDYQQNSPRDFVNDEGDVLPIDDKESA